MQNKESTLTTNNEVYLIGPSHLHSDFTSLVSQEIEEGVLFKDCILDGHHGIPNWSKYIYDTIKKEYISGKKIVWLLADYKVNNIDYNYICNNLETNTLEDENKLFLYVMGEGNNITKELMEPNHISTLGFYTINIVDKIVHDFPNIKLLFWSLYTRSRLNKSSYPIWMQYKSIKQRYINNIIDIDLYTSPEVFFSFIRDPGGHPSKQGYSFINNIIYNPHQNHKHKHKEITLNKEFFLSKTFFFSRANEYDILPLTLNEDGSIGLHRNANETSWEFKDNHLYFISNNKEITTEFYRYEIHNNIFYLIGDFILDKNVKHILKTDLNI